VSALIVVLLVAYFCAMPTGNALQFIASIDANEKRHSAVPRETRAW
jgi:hypothetical protein